MQHIYLKEFIHYCQEQLGLSQHSLKAYHQDLKAFEKFVCTLTTDDPISAGDIIDYQKHLREKLSASPATIRRRIVTLRSYYRWKVENYPPFCSPFDRLRLDLKIPQRLPRPLDRPTLAALFQNTQHLLECTPAQEQPKEFCAEQITGLVTRLMVVTGMRVGEITCLNVANVSAAGTQIRVHGKGNRERTVYITNQKLLDDFRFYWRGRYQQDGAYAPLFLNARGSRLTSATLRKRLRAISEELLIEPHLTPHRFRHSAATMLIEEGVDIRLVQRLLGHASISTTELYTKVSDNSLLNALQQADTLGKVDF